MPGVLAVLRGRLDDLSRLMDAEPGVVNQSFPELDCGQSGGRSLLLQGGTLLHVAAEYGNVAAATLLLDRGANVNARATVDEAGIGGQTPIFHAVTQFDEPGLPTIQLLLERGADLSLRVRIPGSYERPGEIVECTPLGYALLFGGDSQRRTITLLRRWSASGVEFRRSLGTPSRQDIHGCVPPAHVRSPAYACAADRDSARTERHSATQIQGHLRRTIASSSRATQFEKSGRL
jgi:ankyrin repeat protein